MRQHHRCRWHVLTLTACLSPTFPTQISDTAPTPTPNAPTIAPCWDAAAREAGLNLAVATMQIGEVAAVYVQDPKYGYGDKGSFSFPSVPPQSLLTYQVALLAWEAADEVIAKPGGSGLGFRV